MNFYIRKIFEHLYLLIFSYISKYIQPYCSSIKLSFWNVRYGLNCRIIGPLRLRMTHDAKIIVGHHLTAIAGYNSTIVSSKKNVWSVVGGQIS